MAQKIEVITANSKDKLVKAVNDYMAEQGKLDSRVVIELAGGVTYTTDADDGGVWIATVMHSAPHKRSFEDGEG